MHEDDVSQASPIGTVMHDLMDFLRDGGNMLVRSALLQVMSSQLNVSVKPLSGGYPAPRKQLML